MPDKPSPAPAAPVVAAASSAASATSGQVPSRSATSIVPAAGVVARVRAASRLAGSVALAPVYRAYAARLRAEILAHPVPQHVALIMDGNRRWARELGLHGVRDGHSHGADKAIELLDWCSAIGIREVTLWALSLENLARPAEEVAAITEIARETLDALAQRDRVRRMQMSLQVIGRRDLLPERLREAAERGEAETRGRTGLRVTLALGYSGRDELVEAARAAIRSLVADGTAPEALADALTAERLAAQLYTSGSSDPDLIIRTSGEVRLSGFLPWQSAYSEFYFCDVYWPAFREIDLLRAVRTYQQRARRFGR
jgi:short-chain Z-isoprenyl diphosphate synthase